MFARQWLRRWDGCLGFRGKGVVSLESLYEMTLKPYTRTGDMAAKVLVPGALYRRSPLPADPFGDPDIPDEGAVARALDSMPGSAGGGGPEVCSISP